MLVYKSTLLRKIALTIGLAILIGVSLLVSDQLENLSVIDALRLFPFYLLGFVLVTLRMYVVFEQSFFVEHLEISFRDFRQVKRFYSEFSHISLDHVAMSRMGAEIGTSSASTYRLLIHGDSNHESFDLAKYKPHGRKNKINLDIALGDAQKISEVTGLPVRYSKTVEKHIGLFDVYK